MQVDQDDDAGRRGSQGSDPGGSGSTPQLGSKLRDKLQKLAKRRIDSTSIEFPEDGPEFRGGFATVSRAFLVSTSASKSSADDSAQTGGENKSDGGTPKRKAIAVKKLKIENGKDKERVLGLALREAGFVTELSHKNVVKLEGFVEDLSEDRVWLVFPWAENGNLKDFVASANWEIPERIWLIDDVARGVAYLHKQNPPIYLGDLKSANVLVNSGCRAVITDFGSARRLTKKDPPVQPKKTENGTQAALLLETEFCETTNTITLKGNQYTLRWAPPELLKDDEPGLWSDIWALGWVFYEVMTNSIPFQNVQKDSVVVIHVIQGNLPSAADHASMLLIRRLYSLMVTCWSIDPSERPTAEECRKSISRMPMIIPDRQRNANISVSRTRSPELLIQLGRMHRSQGDYINATKFYTEALGIYMDTSDDARRANSLLGSTLHNSMQLDQNDDADRSGSQGSGPDPGSSGSTTQPSSKPRDKLQKLAKWRIDSSSIEFPEDGPEFCGGFATVSRAFLVATSASESSADDPAQTGGENKSNGGTPNRKAIAVKKLKIENGKDKERVLGLALREAGFLTELSHKNVIKLEGFLEDLSKDRVWLVFPWADNGNLKDFVASADWGIPERIWLIENVTRGVEYLHNQNPPICHGDLKSANVLVNSNCCAVITDFGSTRHLTKTKPPVQPEKSENGAQPALLLLETELCEVSNTMTLTGNKFTLRWAAPELLNDDEPGLWSDIWALGWIFYEVMTNSIPFQSVQKDSAVVIHVIKGNLPSIGHVFQESLSDVAHHARTVLIRALHGLMSLCWSIDPSKRPTAEKCLKSMNWMPTIIPDLQRASDTSSSGTPSHVSKLLLELGRMHQFQQDYTNASKFYTEVLRICTGTVDNAGTALAPSLFGLAQVNLFQRDYSKAAQLYSEVIQIYTDVNDRQGRAGALCGRARVHQAQKEYSEAVLLYSEAAQIYTDIGDRQGRASALWRLAEVHRLQKQYSQAVQLFSEALQIRIDIGDRDGRALALIGLADVHRDQDQHEDATRLYEQAAGIFEEIGKTHNATVASNRAARSRQKLKPAETE